MNYRTDFADEIVKKQGKTHKKRVINKDNIKMTIIDILTDENEFNKEKGKYISLEFQSLDDEIERRNISYLLIEALKKVYKIQSKDKVLIVGLGNDKIIADSLGPMVADKVMVTNHLFSYFQNDLSEDIKKVCVFTPKVMGQTGLESADLIKAVTDLYKPNVVIVIDALASSSIKRINKVIQLSDTGIAPGSGVGNYRKEINQKNLKCKVIAIGVATVVEATNIIKEIIPDYNFDNNKPYNLILTPKEIDEDIEHISTIIAESINKYVHNDYLTM